MEAQTQDFINHPYYQTLQSTLKRQKDLLFFLQKRLALIGSNAANLSEFECNEIEISKIKTESEIDILEKVIRHKELYFIDFHKQLVQELEILEKQYDNVLIRARKSKNIEIKKLLDTAKWEVVNSNIEVKNYMFKRLKSLL